MDNTEYELQLARTRKCNFITERIEALRKYRLNHVYTDLTLYTGDRSFTWFITLAPEDRDLLNLFLDMLETRMLQRLDEV